MAFESVDIGSLKGSISKCQSSINYTKSKEVYSAISNNEIWQTASRDNLSQALNKLGTRYSELTSILGICSKVADLISDYKDLEIENKNLEAEIADLNSRLYETRTRTVGSGKNKRTESYQVKNMWVAAQINIKKNKIEQNKIKMKKIETQVAGMV